MKVDDLERHGTSTFLETKSIVPLKLCDTSGESQVGEENISSDKELEDIKSGIVGNAAGSVFGLSTKVKPKFSAIGFHSQAESFCNL